ncbi:LysR family transcriptional regulator [Pseudoalteromonas sp. SMS1]|uniref:LysR family transcriptional regulator n=1 Tax=Pseudoalteromonas sp. SMS1 TaxID=2908894 RepID=UPI001F352351|nr:LysR family transcriptional regulator [Pseudoalteromonas sp. SMS1]MCF2856682.1 LysR family transcriptional regulator [Pseudoalteromonas sp. SMS1]
MSFADVQWRNIDLNLLVAFAYLYRYESVSIAAEKNCVSQSAMSHSLARLRILFDDPLFERQGHKMVPTERAQALSPSVTQILELVTHDLLTTATFEPSQYQGVCRIGLTDYAEFIFAPLIYDAIRQQASHAQISFINVNRSNYMVLAEQEKLDVVIGSVPVPDKAFECEHLYTERHVCLADLEMVDINNGLTPSQFAEVDHALVSPDGQLSTPIDKTLQNEGLTRQVTVATRNFLTVQSLLKQRRLVAIVPQKMADIASQSNGLGCFQPPIPVADFDISMLWFSRKQRDDKNRWLRQLLKTVIT